MRLSKIIPSIAYNTFFQIGAFALILFLGSCDNENEQITFLEESQGTSLLFDKIGIEKAELKEKLAYKNHHLTNLMEEALRIKPDFEEQLQKKTSSSSFYFEDLLSENIINKGRTKRNDSIQFSMDAFLELEGESWYPYVQKIKDGRGEESLYLINSYDPDTEREIVQGYKIDKSGKLELKYRDLSEEDIFGANPIPETLGNDVYVLGISPDNVEPIKEEQALDCEGGGCYGGSGSGNTNSWAKIEYIKIKDKKESWLEKADVKFEVVTATPSSLNPQNFRTHCGLNVGLGCYWNGSFLVHCNNGEVGDKRLVNRDMGILQFGQSAVIGVYVIFEYDAWPAPTHDYERTFNGEPMKVGYRSYQSPYDELAANFHDQNPYNLPNGRNLSRNNSDIEYNLK